MIARAATEPVTQREVKAELARVNGETEKFQQLEHSEELEAFRTGFRVSPTNGERQEIILESDCILMKAERMTQRARVCIVLSVIRTLRQSRR